MDGRFSQRFRLAGGMHAALATLVIGTASLVVATSSQHLQASPKRLAPGRGHVRIEVGLRRGPSEICESQCILFQPRAIQIPTPKNVESVDLTLTVGLQYRTSAAKDHAELRVELSPSSGPVSVLHPGAMRLSSRTATSTTLTWIGRNLPGAGVTYTLLLSAHVDHGAPPAFVSTQNVVVVADAWPAGAH